VSQELRPATARAANSKGLIAQPRRRVRGRASAARRNVIGGIVEQQIEYPNTAGRMPKLPLTTRQAPNPRLRPIRRCQAARTPACSTGRRLAVRTARDREERQVGVRRHTTAAALHVKAATATAVRHDLDDQPVSTAHNLAIQQAPPTARSSQHPDLRQRTTRSR